MNEKISIIIPNYNSEKYIEKCLNSIEQQTYENIEIICIDNNSDDNSLSIIEKFKKKDKRFVILNNKKRGVSEARNLGINYASGDYIMFVDSDDWIDCRTCEISLRHLKEKNADVVMWPYIKEYGEKSEKKEIFNENISFEGIDAKEKLHRRYIGIIDEELRNIESADALCTVWGKLYKSDIIKNKNIQFVSLEEIGTYEDGLFNLNVFENVYKVVYINEYLYHYRKDNINSITSKVQSDLELKWNKLFKYMETYIKNNNLNDNYKEALQNRIALSIIGIGINVVNDSENFIKKIKEIRRLLKKEKYKEAYKNLKFKYLKMQWKIFFFCCKYNLSICLYLLLKVISIKTRS